jgi:8-oxo-dGTP diphosphatase
MKKPPIEVVAAILCANKKVLVGQRMADDSNAGKWEFPGGKIKLNETPEVALTREIEEELGVTLTDFTFFEQVHFDYDRYSVNIRFYLVDVKNEIDLKLSSHDELKWIYPHEHEQLDFLEANKNVLRKLSDMFNSKC